jgi:chitin disaccharide deacetylase
MPPVENPLPRQLIINADDYGLSAGVSAGIRNGHQHGVITSTTCMMNFPRAIQDIEIATAECPDLGLGVHLVLTAGSPVRPAARVASLLMANGSFPRFQDWSPSRWQAIERKQLHDEWLAQIDLFMAAAQAAPTHLDSHHFISYFHPKPLEVMLTLADELGLPVRNPLPLPNQRQHLGDMEESARSPIAAVATHWQSTPHPQGLVSNWLGDGSVTGDALLEALAPGETAEAMCHPAQCDADLRALSSMTDAREQELAMLCAAALRDNLAQRGIRLVTFAPLSRVGVV